MTPISEATFIIVDVETNGSDSVTDRITDVACISLKNNEIISVFSSLVNPHQHIPSFIQEMTGITDEMVKDAPEAVNIMPIVRDLLTHPNTYFVAHNYGFDWKFIAESIKRENLLLPEISKICTLKLARKIVSKSVKRNVGALAEYFNIPIMNRHRAFDDAFATACFFIEILEMLKDKYDIHYVEEILEFQDRKANRIPKLDIRLSSKINNYKEILPNSYGILKFIDNNKNIIHITKSNNLKEHFLTYADQVEISSKKVTTILKEFSYLEWITVNSELENSIMFQKQIMQHKPKYNLLDVARLELNIANSNSLFGETNQDNISKYSVIVLLPNSLQDKTIDIYYILESRLKSMITIGKKSKLDEVFNITKNIFFSENCQSNSEVHIEEMQTVNTWIKKYKKISKIIYIEKQSEEEVLAEIEKIIKEFDLN